MRSLLVPTVIAFAPDRLVQRRQTATITAQASTFAPKPARGSDLAGFLYCSAIALAILVTLGVVFYAARVDVWPYSLRPSFRHFDFAAVDGGGAGASCRWFRWALSGMVSAPCRIRFASDCVTLAYLTLSSTSAVLVVTVPPLATRSSS